MNHRGQMVWKGLILTATAGVVLATSPAGAELADSIEAPIVRLDNRGPGSLNSGSGATSRGENGGGERGRRGTDDVMVAQAGDVRQEDRREDRREDRSVDRREDRRDNSRSNSGGELRSLDRADRVAGDRGQQGRDNARAAQMDRPNRVERPQRTERPERPQRPERPERPEKPERAGRH